MKNITKRIMAVLTFSAITLTSFSAVLAAEASYDMITPVSSQKVTFEAVGETKNRHVSGSAGNGGNVKIKNAPDDSTNYCYYMGDYMSASANNANISHGMAFGGDTLGSDNAGNRQNLAGVGVLNFDMYIEPTAETNAKVTQMIIRGVRSDGIKNIGEVYIQSRVDDNYPAKDGKAQYVQLTGNKKIYKEKAEEGVEYITYPSRRVLGAHQWYSCALSVNVPAQSWKFVMKDKASGEIVFDMDVSSFASPVDAVKCVEFLYGSATDVDCPRIYIDNLQTTREAFLVGTPTIEDNGNGYTATVEVKNETSTLNTPPTLILAVYDEHSRLVDVNWCNVAGDGFLRGAIDHSDRGITLGTTTLTCDVEPGHTAKAFVWNSLSMLTPYITPVTPAE